MKSIVIQLKFYTEADVEAVVIIDTAGGTGGQHTKIKTEGALSPGDVQLIAEISKLLNGRNDRRPVTGKVDPRQTAK